MEPVSAEGDVGVEEPHGGGDSLLKLVAGVEEQFDPATWWLDEPSNETTRGVTYPVLPLLRMLYLMGLPICLLPRKAPCTILSNKPVSILMFD